MKPAVAKRMRVAFESWNTSVDASFAGKDYPEGTTNPSESEPHFWMDTKEYEPYFEEWKKSPEYAPRLK